MDLEKMAREMGKAIQASEEYKRLEIAKKNNDDDKELQNTIEEFNMVRVKLSTMMQDENADEKKATELDSQLKELYTKAMGNKNMMEYNIANQEMEAVMQKINNILMQSVNGEDPETCEAEPHSCSGSCDSCGGCH